MVPFLFRKGPLEKDLGNLLRLQSNLVSLLAPSPKLSSCLPTAVPEYKSESIKATVPKLRTKEPWGITGCFKFLREIQQYLILLRLHVNYSSQCSHVLTSL